MGANGANVETDVCWADGSGVGEMNKHGVFAVPARIWQGKQMLTSREMCLFIHSKIATGTYRSRYTRKPARLTILVILHTSTYSNN